jgi:hypothetical protein
MRTLVTGAVPRFGGGGKPQRIIVSSRNANNRRPRVRVDGRQGRKVSGQVASDPK